MKTNSPALAITGCIFIIQALFFTALTGMLSDVIRKWEALDISDVLYGCVALTLVGLILAIASIRHPLSKAGAGIGVALLAGQILWLF